MERTIAIAKSRATNTDWQNLKTDLETDYIDWQYFGRIGQYIRLNNNQCGEPFYGSYPEISHRLRLATPLLEYLGTKIHKNPERNIYVAFTNVTPEAWVYIDRCARTKRWDDRLVSEWEQDEGFKHGK